MTLEEFVLWLYHDTVAFSCHLVTLDVRDKVQQQQYTKG